MSKFIIYQVLPRLFGNENTTNKKNGPLNENGCGKFNSFTPKALKGIKSLRTTHIWYTGIIEHATQTDYSAFGIRNDHPGVVKGKAGSPYAIKDYYDVDPDLAENVDDRMAEFEALVTRTHKAGMKVIIDFVPNHVARQYHSDAKPKGVVDLGETDHSEWAFSPLNNFYYIPNQPFQPQFDASGYTEFPAKATGNDQFTSSPGINDWYETIKLNYGVNYVEGGQKQFDPIPDTWFKMRDILLYWASKKVDGFRCDMAEMVPVEFWGWVIAEVKTAFPEILFIAEVYNPNEYKNYIFNGKFDYLYDKVGLYDTLRNVVSRNSPASDITNAWQALDGLESKMLNFLENHDEQRVGSDFFSGNGIYAKTAMIVSATLTQGPVMIYAGQEVGEMGMDDEGFSGLDGRTTIFDYWGAKSLQSISNKGKYDGKGLNPEEKNLYEFYRDLLNICVSEKAITHGLMYDLEYANFNQTKFNTNKQFAYFRKYDEELILVVLNFDDKQLDTEIRFPIEVFPYLGIVDGTNYSVVDLIEKQTGFFPFNLSSKEPLCMQMPARKGLILKLTKTE
jgi:glycosidase